MHKNKMPFPFAKGMKKFDEVVTSITGIKRDRPLEIHIRSQEDRNLNNRIEILQMRIRYDGAMRREFDNGEWD